MAPEVNYGKFTDLIKELKEGDALWILSHKEIDLYTKDDKPRRLSSPFESNREYEKTIRSFKKNLKISRFNKIFDYDKKIQISIVPKLISGKDSLIVYIRKWGS